MLRCCALLHSTKLLQPVFGFQLYWLTMNFHLKINSGVVSRIQNLSILQLSVGDNFQVESNSNKLSIRNSSIISKVESRKLAGALDSCFALFGTLQQCALTGPGRNRTRDLTVRNQVSNRCATSARSRLKFSTLPINEITRIILHCLVCYTHIRRNGGSWNSRLHIRWSTYCRFYASNELTTQIFCNNDELLIGNSNKIPYYLSNKFVRKLILIIHCCKNW